MYQIKTQYKQIRMKYIYYILIINCFFFVDKDTGKYLSVKGNDIILSRKPTNFKLKKTATQGLFKLMYNGKKVTINNFRPILKSHYWITKFKQRIELTISSNNTVNIKMVKLCLINKGKENLVFKFCKNNAIDFYMCKTPDCRDIKKYGNSHYLYDFTSNKYCDNTFQSGSYCNYNDNLFMNNYPNTNFSISYEKDSSNDFNNSNFNIFNNSYGFTFGKKFSHNTNPFQKQLSYLPEHLLLNSPTSLNRYCNNNPMWSQRCYPQINHADNSWNALCNSLAFGNC